MAESFVNVTEGSGKKLHTNTRVIGADTVHDEVTVDGEAYLATYAVTFNNVDASTNGVHLIALMAGASLKLRIREIHVNQHALATAAGRMSFTIRRLTTAGTGGTVVTPVAFDPADAAAGATARVVPGTPGTETAGSEIIRGALGMQSAAPNPGTPGFIWEQEPNHKPIIVSAGTSNGIALIVSTATGTGTPTVSGYIIFDESNF